MQIFKRSMTAIARAAEERIRERLIARNPSPPQQLLRACEVSENRFDAGKAFLERLGKELSLDAYRIRPDERMVDLFRVGREHIGIEISPAWEQHGFETHIEPFAYDIMYAVEKVSSKERWTWKWKSLPARPRKEDEWIALFMSMTFGEFVRFVVDMMP